MPTHTVGLQGQQDPIRLKNLLNEAERQLSGQWMRPAEARVMLEPARALLTDSLFWTRAGNGLAIFLSPDSFQSFQLAHPFEEMLVVGDQFRIRPLLPVLDYDERFYVLSLSQNKTALYEGDLHRLVPLETEGLPGNMVDALNYDGADPGMQVHSGAWGSAGKQGAVFHGQGGIPDSVKNDLRAYFRLVNSAVGKFLNGSSAPLLLVCVDYLAPLYRDVNSYPHLLPETVEGNSDYLEASQLHERVKGQASRYFQQKRRQALETLRQRNGGRTASCQVEQIVPAACQGRVDTLFVAEKGTAWGVFQPAAGVVTVHEQVVPDDVDLMDMSIVETLKHRGTVYAVPTDETPAGAPLAALFRY
jgi:hypothetical protein